MTAQQSTSCVAITRSLRLLFVLFTGTLVSSVFSFVVQLMLARLLGTARYIDGISVTATTSVATLRHAFAHTLSEARDASA